MSSTRRQRGRGRGWRIKEAVKADQQGGVTIRFDRTGLKLIGECRLPSDDALHLRQRQVENEQGFQTGVLDMVGLRER